MEQTWTLLHPWIVLLLNQSLLTRLFAKTYAHAQGEGHVTNSTSAHNCNGIDYICLSFYAFSFSAFPFSSFSFSLSSFSSFSFSSFSYSASMTHFSKTSQEPIFSMDNKRQRSWRAGHVLTHACPFFAIHFFSSTDRCCTKLLNSIKKSYCPAP